ncbi:Uma2 family endonuclease [Thiocystis violacea]|uniref:Uma2 family endonuclease n=1 Tax=Thiocystis violacea TaxID=13725 RepID=UPI001903D8F5|nr:Uma2 family endonuclease [Thiocystis violacea]
MEAIDYGRHYHRIDIEQFHRMIEAGVFRSGDRVELIEGEMLDMSPIGSPHIGLTAELNMIFAVRLSGKAIVTAQGAVVLDKRNEVYPDLLVLAPRVDYYKRSKPRPSDVLLLIEVSDSSLKHDLKTKLPIYARHGVAQVWILDIQGSRVHVFRDPDPTSTTYRETQVLTEGDLAIEIAGVTIALDVASLFRA